jgi:capsular exopolysaccharide synthesis family protein
MNWLVGKTTNISRSLKADLSVALENMPLEDLEKIVHNLRVDLEKAARFVSEQEEELNLQHHIVAELEEKLKTASKFERMKLEIEMVSEQEKQNMLEATLVGQRQNLHKREDIYNQHWQVLRRRQSTVDNNGYKPSSAPKSLGDRLEEQSKTDDLEDSDTSPKKNNNLRPYFRTFRRKSWLIAGITSVTTFIALFASATESQVYTGNFYLLVEPITSAGKLTDPTTLTRTGGVPNEELFALDYPTNLAFLQSPGMTSRIAQDVHNKISQDIYGKDFNRSVPAIWEDLRENLTVQRIGEGKDATKIFEVTYKGTNSQEVLAVLQTAADTFLNYSTQDRDTNIKAGIKFIEQQLPSLQQRLNNLKSQQQKLRQQNELIDPIAKSEELLTQISKLNEQVISNQSQLDAKKKLYNVLQQQLKLTPQQALAAAALSQDPERITLLRQLQEIENQLAVASAIYTSKSPQLQTLQDKRQNLVNLLDRKTQQILNQNSLYVEKNSSVLAFQDPTRLKLIDQLVDTANQIQMLEVNGQSLSIAKNTLESEAGKLPSVANQYSAMERQIELTNQILDKLLMQRETLKVEAAQELPWKLISPPQIPLDADGQPLGESPGRRRTVALGAVSGLLLGMILAILLEKRRDTFYTSKDIQDIFSLPVIGEIPHDEGFSLSPNLALGLDQYTQQSESDGEIDSLDKSPFLTAFEVLYAQICFFYNNPPVGAIAVCSVESEDGQSTVASYLAKTVANMGKRVLLVDCNFRNPQLHDWLNLPNNIGLTHVLSEQYSYQKVIQSVPDTNNLFVLTTGISQSDPSIRVWSSQMQHLMEELNANYDLVIYDCPKFLDSTDSSFIAAHTDGILMVVGIGKTRQSLVKKAVKQINTFNLSVLGVVANHP